MTLEILTDDLQALRERWTRRAFLGRSAAGLGSLALGLVLDPARYLRGAPRPHRSGAG